MMKPDKLPALSEKDFARQVEDLLKLRGWEYFHTYEQFSYARRSTRGFPDYLIFRGKRVLAVELKSEKGELTAVQLAWKFILEEAGIKYYCWRPSMWNEIMKESE